MWGLSSVLPSWSLSSPPPGLSLFGVLIFSPAGQLSWWLVSSQAPDRTWSPPPGGEVLSQLPAPGRRRWSLRPRPQRSCPSLQLMPGVLPAVGSGSPVPPSVLASSVLEASVPVYAQGRVLLEACCVSTQHQGGLSCPLGACDRGQRVCTAASSSSRMCGQLPRPAQFSSATDPGLWSPISHQREPGTHAAACRAGEPRPLCGWDAGGSGLRGGDRPGLVSGSVVAPRVAIPGPWPHHTDAENAWRDSVMPWAEHAQ